MDKAIRYHEIYNELYNQTQKSLYKKIIFPPFFLLLPFAFTFFLSSFLLIDNRNENQIVINDTEILFDNFMNDDFLQNKLDSKYKISNDHLDSKYKISNDHDVSSLSPNIKIKPKKLKILESQEIKTSALNLENVIFSENLNKKKLNFIKTILPIVVKQNEEIILTRSKLKEIQNYLIINKTLDKSDQVFLSNAAKKYSIKSKNIHKLDMIEDLLNNVDIIPNSLVIAQAANESGWGSSRFAKDYNALFGEYTYDLNNGVVPAKREEGKKHLIKYFETYEKSVESYFKNINSHSAYKEFRSLRSKLRSKNSSSYINVDLLIRELDRYAEDINYVETLSSIIRVNNLKELDNINSSLVTS
jgi:uncharacterized FlgJ-related protein